MRYKVVRRTSASCLAVLLVAACCSSGADVHLPPLPKAPDTVPPPTPGGEYTLAADDFFPVGSDTPLVIRATPANLMTFREMKAGAHHWFVGPGDDDWKTYDAKHAHLYFGRAVGKGRCEVEFFWSEKDAIKTRKVVIDCQGARPPPDDDKKDDVVPPPKPVPPEPVTGFRVVFVYESSAALPVAVQRVMFGQSVAAYLDGKTTPHLKGGKGWRRFDKDVDAANDPDPAIRELWKAVKPQLTAVPCVVVAVNDRAEILPWPASEEDAVALFKKYRGEK